MPITRKGTRRPRSYIAEFLREYRISLAPGREGRLESLALDHVKLAVGAGAGRCYELLEGRVRPCDGCPAFAARAADRQGPAVIQHDGDGLYRLINVKRGRRAASVYMQTLDSAGLSTLLLGKLNRLAAASRLTEQEKRVLHLLVLGRPRRDIATALGIAARTVKFHQRNALDKLGAEDRNDLLRLLLVDAP
jgi:DNA-binding CsgD family transcriptional regulator